ncbi:MAG: FAD-binding oxidoreductase [Solirubrobacterales bacterium]
MLEPGEFSIAGRVATPADADWDQARAAWNLAADQRPEAVAFAESAADVQEIVRFAADRGLRVAPQGTGHGATSIESLEGAVLLKTERMRGIEVDVEAGSVRVEAGVLAAELGIRAGEHGLCSLPGSSPDVGVVGYTVGGGLSWLGRRYGFACNRVLEIELVTAAGEALTADAEREPDLFWALRGGGGGFGVITALRLDLVPVETVHAGALLFPASVGAAGVRAYRDWAADLPDHVTSIVRFLTVPDIPQAPEPLRGQSLLTIDAACIGGEEEGRAIIDPLRGIATPLMDTFAQIPTARLCEIHMDAPEPVPGIGEGQLISELPDEAIDAFVGVAGPGSGSPLLLSELRQLGGALGRPAEGSGALSHLDAGFAMFSVGMPMTPELGEAISSHLQLLEDTMRPWAAEGSYFNFDESPCDVDSILPADVCAKLAEVKRSRDPEGRILANHGVAAASS